MFISTAYAQAAPAGGGSGAFEALLPMLLIFVVFWFLLIRPQQKRVKQHKEMLGSLRRGDRVVTGGGILGQITKVLSETEVQVEIAEGVRVRVLKGTITEVLAKTEPVSGSKDDGEAAAAEPAAKKEAPVENKSVLGRFLGKGR